MVVGKKKKTSNNIVSFVITHEVFDKIPKRNKVFIRLFICSNRFDSWFLKDLDVFAINLYC